MAGNKDIQNTPNKNTNGFKENPQNINKKGRPVSIREQLKDLLATQGKLKIPKEQIISIEPSGDIIIKMPTEMQLAMKLKQIAMSGKGANTLRAIQMIMEQIDGKPDQNIKVDDKRKSINELFPPDDEILDGLEDETEDNPNT